LGTGFGQFDDKFRSTIGGLKDGGDELWFRHLIEMTGEYGAHAFGTQRLQDEVTYVTIDQEVVDDARTYAGEPRRGSNEQPNLLIVDAVEYVLQGHQSGVVDEVGIVNGQEHRSEMTHGNQKRVKSGPELAKVAFTVIVDEGADRFYSLGDLVIGVTQ
jgi:hypothetical protein